ncbi:hypothetical protein HNQ08_002605 [Deinococcus humi]|uniref:Uncharacterized protein n=1 Tax=Deinococcus humi TaxID=662880 RepID=A0A7W8JUP2_9DEIO|nr:hypothetical protein [Deinococcus humi]
MNETGKTTIGMGCIVVNLGYLWGVTLTLDVIRTTAFDRARSWSDLNPEERRRRAVLAIQDHDAQTLCTLTEASLTMHGSSGTGTSPRKKRCL